jgi:DNA-binding transcriptional ArsR family regulator
MSYVLFSALGDKTRALVFERLKDGPATVTALAEGLPVSRPAVSQHLKVLKEAGLVGIKPMARRGSTASIGVA